MQKDGQKEEGKEEGEMEDIRVSGGKVASWCWGRMDAPNKQHHTISVKKTWNFIEICNILAVIFITYFMYIFINIIS